MSTTTSRTSTLNAPSSMPRGRGRPKGSKNKAKEEKISSFPPVSNVPSTANGTTSRTIKDRNYVPTTLSQIFGDDGTSKFGTIDEDVYQQKLDKMNRNELFRYASKYAIPLNDNLPALRKRLMSEFNKHAVKYRLTRNSGRTFVRTPAKPVVQPVPEKAQ